MNNQNVIIFGGFILTGGTFKDNSGNEKPWKGVTIMLAEAKNGEAPVKAETYKGVYSDSFFDHLRHLAPGTIVVPEWSLSFGQVRLSDLRPASSKS